MAELRPELFLADVEETPAALRRLAAAHAGIDAVAAAGRVLFLGMGSSRYAALHAVAALRDVAAMLRSFDHLGRYVERERWPGHTAEIERWIAAARAAFLDAYGPVDATLLRALEFEKACYEFVYAAEFEPSWSYAPRGGMRWLLEHDGCPRPPRR